MRRFGLLVGVATASAFTFPSPITQTGRVKVASLQMSTQPAPAEKPGFESPKAKLNALAANEKTWGIVTGGETSSPATTTAPSRKWMKVEKKWIDRPKSTAMFPANILAANVPGPFNGGGWAVDKSTDADTVSQMKGSAIWMALGILLIQPFTFIGTYQYSPSTGVVKGEPLSMAKTKATGEYVNCREAYGLPCWPSGSSTYTDGGSTWRPQ